jgi:hypothetical protein
MEVRDAEDMQGKKGSIYIIGNLSRSNTLTFVTRLEWEQYRPGTDRNDDINVFVMFFQGLLHNIIEIPARDYPMAKELAGQLSLRLVPGRPVAMGHGPSPDEKFRLNVSDDRCFTLEWNNAVTAEMDINSSEYMALLAAERQYITDIVQELRNLYSKD